MSEWAKQNNVTQRYIAHLIKMACLAPDIRDSSTHRPVHCETRLNSAADLTDFSQSFEHGQKISIPDISLYYYFPVRS